MKALLAALLALGMSGISERVFAQSPAARQTSSGVVSGLVLSAEGPPIAAATIAVRHVANGPVVGGRITDRDGRFSVGGLPDGSYLVEVRALGRAPFERRDVVISNGGRVDLGEIRLVPAAVQVQGVTAQGQRSAVVFAADRSVYVVRDMPISQGAMATEALRTIPELEVDFEDAIRARGGTPAIYIDGRPAQMQGEALTNFLRSLRADRIDRIEYIANPSASFDSEGESGIVNIVLRRDTSVGFSGSLSGNAGTQGMRASAVRLNNQEGRLTVFGGVTVNLSDATTSTYDLRQNFSTEPMTFFEQSSVFDRESSTGSTDVQAEWRFTPRSTLWASGRANWGTTDHTGLSGFVLMDAVQHPTERFEQLLDGYVANRSWGGSLGFRRVVQPLRNEFSTEIRYGVNWIHAGSDFDRYLLALGTGEQVGSPQVINDSEYHDDEVLSFQADLSRPLGANGKVEVGYRVNLRDNQDEQRLYDYAAPNDTSARSEHDLFKHLEDFHAAYVTLERRVGKLTAQAGIRAERADTRVYIPTSEVNFENDKNQLYPSANLAYDFGSGRNLRLSYSKRVQRPTSSVLNPINLEPGDPFNRSFGNPYLSPVYRHSASLDASWSGQFGTLRAAPNIIGLRNMWGRVRAIDPNGVSNLTYENAADMRYFGASTSASLRQWGPLSGSIALNFLHGRLEGNKQNVNSYMVTTWTSNANVMMRVSRTLNLQGGASYSPWWPLAQGRRVSTVYTSFALRKQLFANKASLAVSVLDPFDVYRVRFVTLDGAHEQNGRTNPSQRRATISLTYNFGETPQSNRRTVQDAPAGDPTADDGIR